MCKGKLLEIPKNFGFLLSGLSGPPPLFVLLLLFLSGIVAIGVVSSAQYVL